MKNVSFSKMNFLSSKVNRCRLTSRTSTADGALLLLCYTYEILQKYFSSKFDQRAFYQLNADSLKSLQVKSNFIDSVPDQKNGMEIQMTGGLELMRGSSIQ